MPRLLAQAEKCGKMDGKNGSPEGFLEESALEMGQGLQAEWRCREESRTAGEFSMS